MEANKGFTLIEIAMVLVVIGLLIGGVLKGQEMVVNSKLKRLESDRAGIAAAMFSYQDRYLHLPGDDNQAIDRFESYQALSPANVNGNGRGTIEGSWDANITTTLTTAGAEETEKFFAHLRAAGLIPGDSEDTTRATNAYGGKIGVQDGSLMISGHVIILGQLEGTVAKIIESRLDDGNPQSGFIQADQTGQPMSGAGLSTSTSYEDAERYNMAFHI